MINSLGLAGKLLVVVVLSSTAISGIAGPSRDVLSPSQWQRIDQSSDRALAWLASRQEKDGSFPTANQAQPAVTCLTVLAFMSNGHLPGLGEYGEQLDQAVEFILNCQRKDGLLSYMKDFSPKFQDHNAAACASYNHGIAGMTLCQLYGMNAGKKEERIADAIKNALKKTYARQDESSQWKVRDGGWRYFAHYARGGSDLSVTSWHLMFLRSARNGGFQVHSDRIDSAMKFVMSCYSTRHRAFVYMDAIRGGYNNPSRSLTGAGIVSLVHGGKYDRTIASGAGNWLLAQPRPFGEPEDSTPIYYTFYSVFGMHMLGGEHWEKFFPATAGLILKAQEHDGSWQSPESSRWLGPVYSTSMVVLALNIPNQLLPIFQR